MHDHNHLLDSFYREYSPWTATCPQRKKPQCEITKVPLP
jgi:hypothetical protein